MIGQSKILQELLERKAKIAVITKEKLATIFKGR